MWDSRRHRAKTTSAWNSLSSERWDEDAQLQKSASTEENSEGPSEQTLELSVDARCDSALFKRVSSLHLIWKATNEKS